MVEEWATHQHKVDVERFGMDELEERGFRDMLITDREFGGRSGVSCSEAAAVPPPQTPAGGDAGCSLTSRRVLPGTVFKVCLFETVQVKKPSRHHFILLAVALSVHLTHWDCFLTNPGGEGGPVCFE